jgi:hypothetical protein
MKLISLAIICIFSSNTFAQTKSSISIDLEKKQIEELEKKLALKKEALKKIELSKEDELNRIESEKKALAEKEEKLRAELKQKQSEITTENKTQPIAHVDQAPVKSLTQFSTRSRDWFIDGTSLVNFMLSNVLKPDGGTTRNRSGQNFYLEAGRNFGSFEISPMIDFSNYDYDSYKSNSLGYGISGSYNFTENTQGNNLVPYARLALFKNRAREDYPSTSSNNDWVEDTSGFVIGAGFKYFPFEQILGLKTELFYRSTNGTYDETGFNKIDFTKTGFNLNFSGLIYF